MPPRNTILIPDDDAPAGRAPTPAEVTAQQAAGTGPVGMPKTVRIILEETDNMAPTGQTFSLNGRAYLIVPGVEVDVPPGIIEILDNAITSVPVTNTALQVVGHRDRLRFPYRVVRRAA